MTNEFEDKQHEEVEEMTSMEDILDQTMDVKIGDTVNGEVLTIDENNQLIVGIEGAGVEGVVPFREISSSPIENIEDVVHVGDVLELVVVKEIKEKENGSFLLSRKRVEAKKIWEELKEKAENDETIVVPVKKVVKGGLVVDAGVRGFIPASMVEDHFVKDFSPYKGKELEVRIVEIVPEENRLILSHKEIAAEKAAKERAEKLAQFEEGEVVTGKVARLTNFGAFIDLGGIDGLVHISEIAHHHVNHPSDELTPGEEIEVKILSIDEERHRISLSIKDLLEGPWENIEEKAPKGAVLEGIVRRLVDFGAFVEVFPGVEGLVHISQISHEHVKTPADKLTEGETVEVKVLDVNPEANRLSLSIKALEEAPERPARDEDNHGGKGGGRKSAPRRQNRGKAKRQHEAEEDTSFTFGDLLGEQLKDLDLDN